MNSCYNMLLVAFICLDSWRLIPKPHKQPRKRWKRSQNLTWILIPGASLELTRAASASSLLSPLESIQFHSTLTECREQLSWLQVLREEGGQGLQNSIHVCMREGCTSLSYESRRWLMEWQSPKFKLGACSGRLTANPFIASLLLRSGGSNSSTSFILSLLPAVSIRPQALHQ